MSSNKLDVHIHCLSPLLSEAIGQCRRALDMSVKEFANKIHKTPNYLFQLERAKIAITSQVLQDCATNLGLSVGELVDIAVYGQVLLLTDEDGPGTMAQAL